ncbi:hypothetical protein BDY21DRAFT_353860 [Lineolata rhizophorae]|uniref:Uncharacterized protein n=1 Tax=Lineolata rhizophorae TaxID=578093 RepID=A0A6A6NQE4_9PEZI|nr:hypothetical protein BDY21DRAFT_353860 [Lineolata rhizophorae]
MRLRSADRPSSFRRGLAPRRKYRTCALRPAPLPQSHVISTSPSTARAILRQPNVPDSFARLATRSGLSFRTRTSRKERPPGARDVAFG